MNTDPKLLNQVCLISREGVCLLDMRQVEAKARELGLMTLANLIETDLEHNRITDGQYFPIVAGVLGVPL
jgi:hypothetical protein